MSYVGTPFKHDIFVSYGRADEKGTIDSPLREWSATFAAHLQKHILAPQRFRREADRHVKVFFDDTKRPGQGVDGLSELTPQLKAAAEESAMLTILMSLDYLDSKWCENERGWWHDKQQQLKLPTKERIAVARVVPTGDRTWPPLLQDSSQQPLPGYFFYDTKEQEDTSLPFGYPTPDPDAQPYKDVFFTLLRATWRQLDDLRARLDERRRREEDAARLASEKPKIYLHGSEARADAWDRAHTRLSDDGFEVWPASPDPVLREPEEQDSLFNNRVQTLIDCDALLLIGTTDEPALDGDLVHYGHRARKSARAWGRHSLPCALLNTVGPAIATDKRKQLTQNVSVDWIDGTQDPWTPRIRTWLESKSADLGRTS